MFVGIWLNVPYIRRAVVQHLTVAAAFVMAFHGSYTIIGCVHFQGVLEIYFRDMGTVKTAEKVPSLLLCLNFITTALWDMGTVLMSHLHFILLFPYGT